MPSPPRAAGNSVLGLGAGPGRSRSEFGPRTLPSPERARRGDARAATAPRCPGCGRSWAPDPQARPGGLARANLEAANLTRANLTRAPWPSDAGVAKGRQRATRSAATSSPSGADPGTPSRAYLGDAQSLLDHAATTTVR